MIQDRLLALRDEKYAAFTAKLIPNIDPSRVVGVRAPQLAQLAKELKGSAVAREFLALLPHRFLEENGLHAALLNSIREYATVVEEVERFLPYVDNWATCDSLSPKVFARHTAELLPLVRRWMASRHEYSCRFGIGMLMRHFLAPDTFRPDFPQWVAAIGRDEFYVKMMQAWYFATALAKQYEAALPYLTDMRLNPWVHNKTIQKAVESRRIKEQTKDHLRSLRIKKT